MNSIMHRAPGDSPISKSPAPVVTMSASAPRLLLEAVQRGDVELLRRQLAAAAPETHRQSKLLLGKLKGKSAQSEGNNPVDDKSSSSPLAAAAGEALRRAASQGRPLIVQELLAWGADMEACDASGQTPLISACSEDSNVNHIAVVRMLLERGADVNACTHGGRTALHKACYYGLEDIALMLLDKGAELDLINDTGSTPLICAVYSKHYRIAQWLLDRGARVDVRNETGKRAVEYIEMEENLPLFMDMLQAKKRHERMLLLWLTSIKPPHPLHESGSAENTLETVKRNAFSHRTVGSWCVGGAEPVDSWLSLNADVESSEQEDQEEMNYNSSRKKRGNLVYRMPTDIVRETMNYL